MKLLLASLLLVVASLSGAQLSPTGIDFGAPFAYVGAQHNETVFTGGGFIHEEARGLGLWPDGGVNTVACSQTVQRFTGPVMASFSVQMDHASSTGARFGFWNPNMNPWTSAITDGAWVETESGETGIVTTANVATSGTVVSITLPIILYDGQYFSFAFVNQGGYYTIWWKSPIGIGTWNSWSIPASSVTTCISMASLRYGSTLGGLVVRTLDVRTQ